MPIAVISEVDNVSLYDEVAPALVELARAHSNASLHLATRRASGSVQVMWVFPDEAQWWAFFDAYVRPNLPEGAEVAHELLSVHVVERFIDA